MKFTAFLSSFFFVMTTAFPFIEISKYTGRWYQVLANPFSYYTTESGGSCVIADYAQLDDLSISVLNSEVVKGKPKSIRAVGTVVNPSEPSKLTVKFENIPFNGTYWIYEIGPEENQKYQYSIVSDDQKFSLFVLVRDLETYTSIYEPKIRTHLSDLGFTSLVPTPQTNCTYR